MTDASRTRAQATKTPAAPAKPAKAAKPAKKPATAAKAKAPSKAKTPADAPAGTEPLKALTPFQQQFALEYVKDFNATRAYQACKPHVSAKTAGVEGHRLLKNPSVQAEAQAARERIANRLELTAERTIQEIARLAYFDPRKLFKSDGTPKAVDELDDDTAAALAGIEVVEEFEGSGKDRVFVGYTKKYRVADKNAALEKAAKILGLFKKDNEQAGNALASALSQFVAKFHGQDNGRLRAVKG
jgi:phage terminase small subunit